MRWVLRNSWIMAELTIRALSCMYAAAHTLRPPRRTPVTDSVPAIRAVILDLDGTLADTAIEIGLALNETLAELGVPLVSLEAATDLIGRGVRSLVERALREVGGASDVDRA